ncbi:vWA domain-containing protein [Fibrobacter sp.]|uniref:vWA domain-containing protein n=1 Tax=Fibrobacter sp. TaxID=35828 RepID=UPI00388F41B5
MKNENLMNLEDLENNPSTRVPVCLVLDTSGSMSGDPINELSEGVRLFYNAVRSDETALYSAEISVVTFGGTVSRKVDFNTLEQQSETPEFYANGGTPMGEAMNMALDMLEQRKSEYKASGVDYYQPWIVLMTDGRPNGDSSELSRAIQRTCDMVNERKLTVFPIGISEEADMDVLARFSPKRPPLKLQGLNFREFFAWLSKSVSKVSQSTPGDKIQLDVDGIKGWAEL